MEIDVKTQLGMRIAFLRQRSKMSQEKLALEIGISKNYLSDVECGRRNPSLVILQKIADGLHIDLSTLFLGVGTKNEF